MGRGWGAAICREAGPDGEAGVDFSRAIRRIQQTAEKARFHARAELLRQDVKRDNLFGHTTDS